MPKMPKRSEPTVIAISRYDKDDYEACRSIDDPGNDMEATYDEWRSYADPVIAEVIANGHKPLFIDVRSHELAAWLAANDLRNSPKSRARYVHEMASAKFATKQ